MSEFKEITIKARVLNNKEELNNMMKRDNLRNYTKDDWLIVSRYLDMETFQPCIVVAIKDDTKPFVEWLKFAAPLELTVDEEVK
jgi:hypothetical protein